MVLTPEPAAPRPVPLVLPHATRRTAKLLPSPLLT